MWAQINHPGKVAVSPFNRRPVAPSARRSPVPGYNIRKPRELTGADIDRLIRKLRAPPDSPSPEASTGFRCTPPTGTCSPSSSRRFRTSATMSGEATNSAG